MVSILVADSLPKPTIAELQGRGHECLVEPALGTRDLEARISGVDVLVVRSTKVDAPVFEVADRLALVIRAGAGTNTIDTDTAAARGVLVANVPGRNSAAVAELRSRGVASVGITGFCMGGLFSYLAATKGVDVDAAVPFYGGRIGENLGEPSCPLLAFFGGSDPYIPTTEIDAVVARHGDAVVVYDDADHGFMRDGSPSYHPTAAPDAWQRALTFLRANLPGNYD